MRIQERVVRAAAVGPPALFGCWVALAVATLLPSAWSAAYVLAVTVLVGAGVAAGAAGAGEAVAARVLCQAHPPGEAAVAAVAPALVVLSSRGAWRPRHRVVVGPGRGVAAAPFGARTVVVTAGLVGAARAGMPAEQVAAVLGAAVGRLEAGHTRWDVLRTVWCLPWQLGVVAVRAAAAVLGPLVPLIRLGWAVRPVVAAVAAVQAVADGYPLAAAAVAVLLASTYAHPWASARWRRLTRDVGDRHVVRHDLGPALAAHLRAVDPGPSTRCRTDWLDPPADVAPAAGAPAPGPRLALVRSGILGDR